MPLFVYDQDRIAFTESIRGALGSMCTSNFIRHYREDQTNWATANKVFDDLGVLEFSFDDSCSLSDLALLAKEVGASLSTSSILQRAFLEGVAKRAVNLELKNPPAYFGYELDNNSLNFIPGNLCKSVVAIPQSGLLSDQVLSVYTLDKSSLTLHACLDITELSFDIPLSACSKQDLSKAQSTYISRGLLVLLSAELCGILEKIITITTEYTKTRKQFGVPIGSFQAVSHQLSDCFLISESSWSLVECAAVGMDEFTVKSAAMYCAENIPIALETTLQLHGGIGFTWEYDLHLYLRRARKIAALVNAKASDYQQLLSLAI